MAAKRANKQEQIYETLRERIIAGLYGPGYRLVIDRIAEEFEMSALPVREAIRRLEAEGLVVFRANAGAQVAPADPGMFGEGMTVLAMLEGYATAEAASRLSKEDIERLEELTDQMESNMEQLDVLGFSEANRSFHQLIYERCGNLYLESLLLDTGRRLDAIRSTVFTHIPYRGLASISDHRELIRLIRKKAPAEDIERAARTHKLNTVAAFRAWQESRDADLSDGPGAKPKAKAKAKAKPKPKAKAQPKAKKGWPRRTKGVRSSS